MRNIDPEFNDWIEKFDEDQASSECGKSYESARYDEMREAFNAGREFERNQRQADSQSLSLGSFIAGWGSCRMYGDRMGVDEAFTKWSTSQNLQPFVTF